MSQLLARKTSILNILSLVGETRVRMSWRETEFSRQMQARLVTTSISDPPSQCMSMKLLLASNDCSTLSSFRLYRTTRLPVAPNAKIQSADSKMMSLVRGNGWMVRTISPSTLTPKMQSNSPPKQSTPSGCHLQQSSLPLPMKLLLGTTTGSLILVASQLAMRLWEQTATLSPASFQLTICTFPKFSSFQWCSMMMLSELKLQTEIWVSLGISQIMQARSPLELSRMKVGLPSPTSRSEEATVLVNVSSGRLDFYWPELRQLFSIFSMFPLSQHESVVHFSRMLFSLFSISCRSTGWSVAIMVRYLTCCSSSLGQVLATASIASSYSFSSISCRIRNSVNYRLTSGLTSKGSFSVSTNSMAWVQRLAVKNPFILNSASSSAQTCVHVGVPESPAGGALLTR